MAKSGLCHHNVILKTRATDPLWANLVAKYVGKHGFPSNDDIK